MDEKGCITIKGQEITTVITSLAHGKLKYYPENPRIRSIVTSLDDGASQEEIEDILTSKDHVKILVQAIKANQGLTDPLIVRDGDFIVLEGNSRLAAYRLLAKKDPIAWGMVKCQILPSSITEDQIFSLLCQYHIIGRTDWAPYEQAGMLWRRCNEKGVPISHLSKELNFSPQKVSRLIEVYSFMITHEDRDVQHWSHYDEYLKSRPLKKRRIEFEGLDKTVVDRVKSNKLKAVEIRDVLGKVAAIQGKKGVQLINKFISSPDSLAKIQAAICDTVSSCAMYKKLHDFRQYVSTVVTSNEVDELKEEDRKKYLYELQKIKNSVNALIKNIRH